VRELAIELNICHCKQLSKDSVNRVAELLLCNGFTLLRSTKGKLSRIGSKAEVPELVEAHFRGSGKAGDTELSNAWSVLFLAYPSDMKNFSNSVFEVQYRGSQQNRLTISGLFDLTQKEHLDFVVPYAELLRRVAIETYPLLQPTLSVVDNEMNIQDAWTVTGTELTVINWVNLWGPTYVQKYGRDFLRGMPGHQTDSLGDDAICHQLSEAIIGGSRKDTEALRKSVVKYCTIKNLDVHCYAPYSLPDSVD
jgi:hypothetical protein